MRGRKEGKREGGREGRRNGTKEQTEEHKGRKGHHLKEFFLPNMHCRLWVC